MFTFDLDKIHFREMIEVANIEQIGKLHGYYFEMLQMVDILSPA